MTNRVTVRDIVTKEPVSDHSSHAGDVVPQEVIGLTRLSQE